MLTVDFVYKSCRRRVKNAKLEAQFALASLLLVHITCLLYILSLRYLFGNICLALDRSINVERAQTIKCSS